MFQTKIVEKIKTYFCPVFFFFFENRAVYQIMLKNIVEPYIPGHYYSLVFFLTLPTYLVLPSLTFNPYPANVENMVSS